MVCYQYGMSNLQFTKLELSLEINKAMIQHFDKWILNIIVNELYLIIKHSIMMNL